MPWLHLPAALWGATSELFGWFCPLTPLESWLRRASGAGGYSGSFVEHYLLPILYPAELTRELQFVLAGLVSVVNLDTYAHEWWHRRRAQSQ